MENKMKTVITVLTTIIVFLIILIISVVIMKKQGYLSFNKKEELSLYDVAGEYTYEFTDLKIDDSNKNKTSFNLKLYKNGIFSYRYNGLYYPEGIVGNYVINDNKIVLTTWFNTGSDVSLIVAKGSKELVINDDKTITDSNIKNEIITKNGIDKVILVKNDNEIGEFDISNSLGNACLNNECAKIYDSNM